MVGLGWETEQPLSPTRLGKESRTPDYLLEKISTTYRKDQGLVGGALHLSAYSRPFSVFSVPGWNWHLQTTCVPRGTLFVLRDGVASGAHFRLCPEASWVGFSQLAKQWPF